jgi:hypothetical protein
MSTVQLVPVLTLAIGFMTGILVTPGEDRPNGPLPAAADGTVVRAPAVGSGAVSGGPRLDSPAAPLAAQVAGVSSVSPEPAAPPPVAPSQAPAVPVASERPLRRRRRTRPPGPRHPRFRVESQ